MNTPSPMQQLPLNIITTAIALPPTSVSSEEISERIGKPTDYVRRRSGIKQRYHASADNDVLSQSQLASQAVIQACAQSNLSETDIDLIIGVNAVPEQAIPCTSSLILQQLGWGSQVACFDINASCIGILPALMTASSFLAHGVYQRIVVVASDLASRGLNWSNEDSSLIFGDGACAMIVESKDTEHHANDKNKDDVVHSPQNSSLSGTNSLSGTILSYAMQSHTDYASYCQIRAGGTARNDTTGCDKEDFYFAMDGKPLFRMVAQNFMPFIENVLDKAGLSKEDIDLWIPHQASHLGLKHMVSRMGMDADKVVNIYEDYGNQVSASMPTALHIARETGKLKQGQTVLLLGTGAGVLFGAMVWQL